MTPYRWEIDCVRTLRRHAGHWVTCIVGTILLVPTAWAGAAVSAPGTMGDGKLELALESVRSAHGLPAIAGFILEGDTIREIAAVGTRTDGADRPVTLDDQWHIGSNTKAMTATLATRFVEDGKLRWDQPLTALLPQLTESMHPAYPSVTFEDLLTHRAGLAANDLGAYGMDTRAQLVRHVLSQEPANPKGDFLYSNLGYIVAGHILENLGGADWETLMERELFRPLQMSNTGFGAPKSDAPWGHHRIKKAWQGVDPKSLGSDNPPILGPAGTVHTTLQDYAKFLALHLGGAQGRDGIVRLDSIQQLHNPPAGFDYAAGWIVAKRPWGGGTVLTHSGSNTMWFATAWLAPERNFAVFAVTNAAGEGVAEAIDAACSLLIQRRNAAHANNKSGASTKDTPD